MNKLPIEKRVQIINLLVEGSSMRVWQGEEYFFISLGKSNTKISLLLKKGFINI